MSFGSSGFAGLLGVRRGGRRVHGGGRVQPGSLDSLWSALGVDGFIRGHWIHCSKPWRSLGSSGDPGCISIHSSGRSVHPGTLGLLQCAMEIVGFLRGS